MKLRRQRMKIEAASIPSQFLHWSSGSSGTAADCRIQYDEVQSKAKYLNRKRSPPVNPDSLEPFFLLDFTPPLPLPFQLPLPLSLPLPYPLPLPPPGAPMAGATP